MRPFGSQKQLENRRRKAMELLDTGISLHEVARKFGCHASSVMRWRNEREQFGDSGLAPKQLIHRLLKGAVAQGYRTELWTTARIAELIKNKFGVSYHQDHIGKLMSSLSWSYQKPARRALERNEKAIEEWKRKQWPRVKKTPRGWAPISSSSTNRDSS
jgi:transposase